MHLTILRTDSVMPQFQADFGDYPDMFADVLRRSAQQIALDLKIDAIDVREGLPDEHQRARSDVYLITGSRHSVYDDLPWIQALADFLAEELKAEKKVIGICFGHQFMAHFFGGHVAPAAGGWGVGVHTSAVTQSHAWMDDRTETLALLCSHKDQVQALPDGADVFLSSAFCPIGGFTMGDQVVTVQGHPEFTKPYSEALMNFRRDVLGEATFAQGVESLSQPLDELMAMRWMLNFARADAGLPDA